VTSSNDREELQGIVKSSKGSWRPFLRAPSGHNLQTHWGKANHSEKEKLLLTTLRPSHKANKTPSTEPPKKSWCLDKTMNWTTWKGYLLHEPTFYPIFKPLLNKL
jgi:hypothetical protein